MVNVIFIGYYLAAIITFMFLQFYFYGNFFFAMSAFCTRNYCSSISTFIAVIIFIFFFIINSPFFSLFCGLFIMGIIPITRALRFLYSVARGIFEFIYFYFIAVFGSPSFRYCTDPISVIGSPFSSAYPVFFSSVCTFPIFPVVKDFTMFAHTIQAYFCSFFFSKIFKSSRKFIMTLCTYFSIHAVIIPFYGTMRSETTLKELIGDG